MLIEKIKSDSLELRKQRNPLSGVLSVLLGDIQLLEAKNKKVSDSDIISMIKKLIKNNNETRDAIVARDGISAKAIELNNEVLYLQKYLPTTLSTENIRNELIKADILEKINSLSNDGQKIGVAMKHFKSVGLTVEVNDVKKAIGI